MHRKQREQLFGWRQRISNGHEHVGNGNGNKQGAQTKAFGKGKKQNWLNEILFIIQYIPVRLPRIG